MLGNPVFQKQILLVFFFKKTNHILFHKVEPQNLRSKLLLN
jgi:hypothetical protein